MSLTAKYCRGLAYPRSVPRMSWCSRSIARFVTHLTEEGSNIGFKPQEALAKPAEVLWLFKLGRHHRLKTASRVVTCSKKKAAKHKLRHEEHRRTEELCKARPRMSCRSCAKPWVRSLPARSRGFLVVLNVSTHDWRRPPVFPAKLPRRGTDCCSEG